MADRLLPSSRPCESNLTQTTELPGEFNLVISSSPISEFPTAVYFLQSFGAEIWLAYPLPAVQSFGRFAYTHTSSRLWFATPSSGGRVSRIRIIEAMHRVGILPQQFELRVFVVAQSS